MEAIEEGVEVYTDLDGNVTTIRLLPEGEEGSAGFPGHLPLGLGFGMQREEVLRVLGEPRRSMEAKLIRILDPIHPQPAWVSWLLDPGVELHCTFPDERLGVVTLQTPMR